MTNKRKKPLKNPKTKPRANVTINAKIGLCPAFNSDAITAPQKASIDPTERSIPPVSITSVIPIAIIELIEVCLNTFNIFA